MVSAVVSVSIVFATLAFGAVYPWGYGPLFGLAACIGLAGIVQRRGVPAESRLVAIGLIPVTIAIGIQVVPLPRSLLDLLTPHTSELLSRYSLAYAFNPSWHELSIDPPATRLTLLALMALGIYMVGLPGLLSGRDLRHLPRNLMIFAVMMALGGIFGREHNNGLVYGFWRPLEGTNSNGFGPFVNRNHFAGWMLMVASLTIGVLYGLMEHELPRVKSGLRNRILWLSSHAANQIALVGVSLVVMATSLVWTLSRSGILSFTSAIVLFGWLVMRGRSARRSLRTGGVAVLAAVLFVSLSWRGADMLATWFGDTTDFVSRVAVWRDGLNVVRDYPVVGTGLNTWADAMLFYQKSNPNFYIDRAHNDYLQVLAEGGLLVCVPLGLAGILLATAIARSGEAVRADRYTYWVHWGAVVALVTIGVQETVEFSLQMPANAFLFATLAAVALSRCMRSVKPAKRHLAS
ncbi:MAG TPA: O-antigen ligase family protein [Vicinamibacterales bacterium]|nr:O-antigen ligase family protein [Vicinamibacterales bacterium]